ncbi:P1 family peptidase [Pseudaestuariivita rosea]|uniref:P1 family peptidase n=1 Tax=Pseudaestuariivita rosea TaxID=2763263 RepID=UPI001ABA8359|nr:P1 family peptidase [Pseudaestuariivita rosea]
MKPGPRNLITDVAGLLVGHAQDDTIKTGCTVLTAGRPFVAGVHIMGGAPGTRETELLAPDRLVQEVDALVLSGGSAFGLDAASGVADGLRAMGRGYEVAGQRVPIVPGAILFDLLNGGQKDWVENPYRPLGRAALDAAASDFALGTVGAGTGATTANLKGGLGSASAVLDSGLTVGALVAVNAVGSVTVDNTPHFWAAPFEIDDEFGALGPTTPQNPSQFPRTKLSPRANTTIGIVATDAALTQAQATRIAIAAHDGLARAIVPAHTPFDGDLVFSAATGTKPASDLDLLDIGHAAATTMARAIARGVFSATSAPGDLLPCWQNPDT